MQLRRAPYPARQVALRAVLGEIGCTALFVVLLSTGGGLLLDFQLTGLHPIFSTALMLAGVPLGLYWAIRRTLSMDRKPSEQNNPYMRNLALAAVAGQSGCSTVGLIFLALFAGLFLDAQLDTHPIFSVGLVLISIPISLYAMIRLVLSATAKITPPPPSKSAGRSVMSSRDQSKENGP